MSEGSHVITKTTTRRTYTTEGSTGDAGSTILASTYRPTLAPRNVIIQRSTYSSGSPGYGSSSTMRREKSLQLGSSYAMAPGSYGTLTTSGVTSVKSSREKEKKDMQDLNERFASYIEKVRFLEAQNKRLTEELEKLKSRWGKDTTQIKAMFQAELDEARKLLDDGEKEKARLEIKVASMEEIVEELTTKFNEANLFNEEQRLKFDRQNQQLADNEGEISLLRRRVEGLEADRDRDKKLIANLNSALNSARANLDDETLKHIDAENRRQTLEEELEFLKSVHEQELKELAALAYRDTTTENRDFWKNEMGSALREIQDMYDEKLDIMRTEIESSYTSKLQEFRTGATKQNLETSHTKEETKRLRTQLTDIRDKMADLEGKNLQLMRELETIKRAKEEMEREFEHENSELKTEIARLRAELEGIIQELQNIMDTKLGLELEIAAYRKLLEGEESRVGLQQLVDYYAAGETGNYPAGGAGGASYSSFSSSSYSGAGGSSAGILSKGEISARTTFQKSAKGPTSIAETSADGKFIVIENTGRKTESLGGWKIVRTVDDKETASFVFPAELKLTAGEKFKLWGKGQKPVNSPSIDIEANVENFGVGSTIYTKLFNTLGEDRATHIQKTVYG